MALVFIASSILSPKLSAHHTIQPEGGRKTEEQVRTGKKQEHRLSKTCMCVASCLVFIVFGAFPVVDIWSISIVFIYRIYRLHIILHLYNLLDFIIQGHTKNIAKPSKSNKCSKLQ